MPASKIVTGVVSNLDNWLFRDLRIGQLWSPNGLAQVRLRSWGKVSLRSMSFAWMVAKPDSRTLQNK